MSAVEPRTPDQNRPWRSWRVWGMAIVLALAMGFLARLHRYVSSEALGEPFTFFASFLRDLPIFGLLNPVRVAAVWVLADRFRFDRASWRRNAVLHVFGALLIAYAHLMAEAIYFEVLLPQITQSPSLLAVGPPIGVMPRFYVQLRSFFQLDFLWYWAIVGAFYAVHYYKVSQERLLESARLEASLIEARMQALRSQLNPHFLFNTLNTISVLALKGEREAVEETISHLSDLLRVALDDSRPDRIALREELEFVEGYLGIQRMRFGDRLTIHREIDADTLGALVPAMILEPIVENAIKHGLAACSGDHELVIRAERAGDRLQLQVTDSGPGFSPDYASRKGIGLANTEKRLAQLYGARHQIDYGSGGGGCVTIAIPFEQCAVARPAA